MSSLPLRTSAHTTTSRISKHFVTTLLCTLGQSRTWHFFLEEAHIKCHLLCPDNIRRQNLFHSLIPCDIQHTCSLAPESKRLRTFTDKLHVSAPPKIRLGVCILRPHKLWMKLSIFSYDIIIWVHKFPRLVLLAHLPHCCLWKMPMRHDLPCVALISHKNTALMRVYVVNKLLWMSSLRFHGR